MRNHVKSWQLTFVLSDLLARKEATKVALPHPAVLTRVALEERLGATLLMKRIPLCAVGFGRHDGMCKQICGNRTGSGGVEFPDLQSWNLATVWTSRELLSAISEYFPRVFEYFSEHFSTADP